MLPAIEAVLEFDKRRGYDPIEVAAWQQRDYSKLLRVAGRNLIGHDLTRNLYNRAADPTDYNLP